MKARYIGETFEPKPDPSRPIVEGYVHDPAHGKIYEVEAVPPITCEPHMNQSTLVLRVYNIRNVSWTTIGYKDLSNFIKSWDFNVDPSEIAVGQDISRSEIRIKG